MVTDPFDHPFESLDSGGELLPPNSTDTPCVPLSMYHNSASCGRLFSKFGLLLIKLRNRLAKKSPEDLQFAYSRTRRTSTKCLRNDTKMNLRAFWCLHRYSIVACHGPSTTHISSSQNVTTAPSTLGIIVAHNSSDDPAPSYSSLL